MLHCRADNVGMIMLVGTAVVLGCVIIGFVTGGGHLLALWHPGEIVIILGAALGAFMISNPLKVVKTAFSGAVGLLKGGATSARITSVC